MEWTRDERSWLHFHALTPEPLRPSVIAMSRAQQCPVCFDELEVRGVRPCFVCGGWADATQSEALQDFTIRDGGTPITLCNICWLEEVLSNQGDLKKRIKINGQPDLVVAPDRPAPDIDKVCAVCNRRLALLELMARRLSEEELETWRR
jgi:hypothetical protein